MTRREESLLPLFALVLVLSISGVFAYRIGQIRRTVDHLKPSTVTVQTIPANCQTAATRATSDLTRLRAEASDLWQHHRAAALTEAAHITALGTDLDLQDCEEKK